MSKLYDLLSSVITKLNKTVRTETQTLTEEQKTQARANIGAMSSSYTPPNQTAEQVGADPKGTATNAVSAHNTNENAHSDIRALISALRNGLERWRQNFVPRNCRGKNRCSFPYYGRASRCKSVRL